MGFMPGDDRSHAAQRDFPARILVVDDDDLELALMSDRLAAAGLEVVSASNGAEALAILSREWFPVVLTDWRMPVMDGMELIERLRSMTGDETYNIMLSAQASGEDFERGYRAGVDDYISKKSPDAELLAHIEAGFNTVMLRRSLKQARGALAAAVHSNSEKQLSDGRAPILRLQAELMRAARYHRALSMILLRVEAPLAHRMAVAPISESLWRVLMQACDSAIRFHDWTGQLDAADGGTCFVIVLPETGTTAALIAQRRICKTLRRVVRESPPEAGHLRFSIGSASADAVDGSAAPDALQFLAAANASLAILDLQAGESP